MAYLILIAFICLLFFQVARRKDITLSLLIYSLIAPNVSVGGTKLDSLYFVVLFWGMLTIISKKKILVNSQCFKYSKLLICIGFIYILGWIVNARVDFVTMIVSVSGIMKICMLFILTQSYAKDLSKDKIEEILFKCIFVVTIANFIAVLFQYVYPTQAYGIFSQMYSSDSSLYYSMSSSTWGLGGFYNDRYVRYFGLFENPMMLGCYSGLALAFTVSRVINLKGNGVVNYLLISLNLFIGTMSATKTFFLIVPIIMIISFIFIYVVNGKKRMKIIWPIAIIIIFVFLYVFYDSIYTILRNLNSNLAYYFSMLKSPLSAFSTRFGNDLQEGSLAKSLEIIRQHPFIGVGPVSIIGETIADNAYIVLLHNGGIIALILVLGFYFKELIKSIKNRGFCKIIIIFVLFSVSMAMPILIGSNISFFAIYYLLADENNYKKRLVFKI